jgi:integrase
MFGIMANAFADFNVGQIEVADVIDFTDQFKHAPSAAKHYKALLSTFFRWAISKRLCKKNPCREIWLPRPPKKALVWTPDIYQQVRGAMLRVDIHDRPFSAGVMMQCYMDLSFLLYQRATDIRLLKWSQISDSSVWFYPTKTRRSSGVQLEIEVTPEIRRVLDRAAAESKRMSITSPYVIHTRKGTAFTRSGIYAAFRRSGKRVGVIGVNAKALRPFAATMAKKAGYSFEELQDGLGHTSIGTTESYVRRHAIRRSIVKLELPQPQG